MRQWMVTEISNKEKFNEKKKKEKKGDHRPPMNKSFIEIQCF